VTIEHVEYLGHETLAHVYVGDAPAAAAIRLIVRLAGMHEFAKGEGIDIGAEADIVHLFDEAGLAVLPRS
jgi:ABC-type sugar transport system ATPase subunit